MSRSRVAPGCVFPKNGGRHAVRHQEWPGLRESGRRVRTQRLCMCRIAASRVTKPARPPRSAPSAKPTRQAIVLVRGTHSRQPGVRVRVVQYSGTSLLHPRNRSRHRRARRRRRPALARSWYGDCLHHPVMSGVCGAPVVTKRWKGGLHADRARSRLRPRGKRGSRRLRVAGVPPQIEWRCTARTSGGR